MILNYLKNVWEFINKLTPETRSAIIMLMFGYVLYSQINSSTCHLINELYNKTVQVEKLAEDYAKETAMEVNRHVRLIAYKDEEAFDVLLLSYHNSKLSLQGYRFLYLSCLTEAPKSIDTPLLKNLWTNLDYIYYVDELEKIHNQSIIQSINIELMRYTLPKFYRLVKASDASAASFYVVEGKKSPVGIIVTLYKLKPKLQEEKDKIIMPSIQKLAILLDYENN